MSWESVRDLKRMRAALLLVKNTAAQSKVPEDVAEWLGNLEETFEEITTAIAEGEKV